jgi:DNA replication protein DnaT
MADFWIKVEKSTPDKAEIFEMAALLDIDPDAVLGKLIRVWSWIDSNSEDGHIKSVTHVLIDRVTCCVGFSDAMKNVGWLTDSEIPNFDRHLGENAKKRAKDSERKRKSRDGHKNSVTEVVTESGLDKIEIREDKDKDKDKDKSNLPAKAGEPKSKRFVPPTLEEVARYMGDYALSKQKTISPAEPEKFINFYESKGWLVGNKKMVSWQASARGWVGRIENSQQRPTKIGVDDNNWVDGLINGELL